MKKALPYIILFAVVALLGVLVLTGNFSKSRSFDDRVTLREKDKIPYGTSAARTLLPSLFPNAEIDYSDKEPGKWSPLDSYEGGQALVYFGKSFNADKYELTQLMRFVKEGNYVFISSRTFSEDVQNYFGFTSAGNALDPYFIEEMDDSLKVNLLAPAFSGNTEFSYPGKSFQGAFLHYDASRTIVLGKNGDGQTNFIRMNAGKGGFFFHATPLAFSNYFLLHKQNSAYFSKAFSVIPEDISKLQWNDYFLNKAVPSKKKPEKNVLSVLMKYPPFKWGLLSALVLLALYLLMEMRRKQRMIPLHHRPVNDSLDFVKTMGRLYHDRKDHGNLARKMANYFLEHVRSRYKLPTHALNEEFIQLLHFKSGYPEEKIREIVEMIHALQMDGNPGEQALILFHRQLELFYQNE